MPECKEKDKGDKARFGGLCEIRYELLLTLIWTVFLFAFLFWNIQHVRKDTEIIALNEARANFTKDMSFRSWAASHDGVYVPVDEKTPPNPNLSHIPERDLTTPSGKILTLMNPPYMMRQMLTEYSQHNGIKGHITSLDPLWEGNEPDQWEARMLKEFEQSTMTELYEIVDMDGKPHLRFMHAMRASEDCLNCHRVQGYVPGDVVGGIGVSVPIAPLLEIESQHVTGLVLSHSVIWLLGLVGLFIGGSRIRKGISERRVAELLIRDILENMGEAIILIDRNYRIVSANKAFCDQTGMGLDDILEKHCYEVTHHITKPCYESGEECPIKDTFDNGESRSVTHVHESADGTSAYVEIRSYPIKDDTGRVTSAIETINDITDRRRLEERLRQSQKMEAVGTLTGGIAHDFNNILTTILGYAEFIREDLEEASHLKKYVDMIINSGTKAARLTQSLLAFSRKQVIRPEPVNVNTVVERMQTMMSRLIGENIEIVSEISPSPLVVMADSVQVEQILMNLATNARDAMPDGGKILVITEPIEIDSYYNETHGFGRLGHYALITLSDNGTGMDTDTLQHIFEPFFTTKDVGKGTGLGLSVVYGIVKQHGGYINVYSEPGMGTTYKILLPLAQEGVVCETESTSASVARKGTETVLMAEDDDAVRHLIRKTLEDFGYTVIEAVDGEDASEKFKEHVDGIDLLLLDMIMPRKNGMDFFKEAKLIKPEVKALMISGYPTDFMDNTAISDEGLYLVMKPIFPTKLLDKVREVLDK